MRGVLFHSLAVALRVWLEHACTYRRPNGGKRTHVCEGIRVKENKGLFGDTLPHQPKDVDRLLCLKNQLVGNK